MSTSRPCFFYFSFCSMPASLQKRGGWRGMGAVCLASVRRLLYNKTAHVESSHWIQERCALRKSILQFMNVVFRLELFGTAKGNWAVFGQGEGEERGGSNIMVFEYAVKTRKKKSNSVLQGRCPTL